MRLIKKSRNYSRHPDADETNNKDLENFINENDLFGSKFRYS